MKCYFSVRDSYTTFILPYKKYLFKCPYTTMFNRLKFLGMLFVPCKNLSHSGVSSLMKTWRSNIKVEAINLQVCFRPRDYLLPLKCHLTYLTALEKEKNYNSIVFFICYTLEMYISKTSPNSYAQHQASVLE